MVEDKQREVKEPDPTETGLQKPTESGVCLVWSDVPPTAELLLLTHTQEMR